MLSYLECTSRLVTETRPARKLKQAETKSSCCGRAKQRSPISIVRMGACTSSSEVITDPYTGQVKVKKTLGGAPPALRRPQATLDAPTPQLNQPLHYVSYGGGNALYLMNMNNHPGNAYSNMNNSQNVQVTLPFNIYPGDTLHVQAPDGRLHEIIVPQGLNPGDRFNVQFASEQGPPPALAIPVDSNHSYTPFYNNAYAASPPYGTPIATNNTTNDTFEVTLPPNVYPGDTLHVQTPSGQIQAVTIPHGIPPGGQFMVRIASSEGSSNPVIASNMNIPIVSPISTVPTNTLNTFEPNIYVPFYSSSSTQTAPTQNPNNTSMYSSGVYVPPRTA